MKLAVEMAVMELDGEWNAVAVGEDSGKFHGMLRLNDAAADIVKLLADETTPADIERALTEKYDESTAEEIHTLTTDFLAQLRTEGLLAE